MLSVRIGRRGGHSPFVTDMADAKSRGQSARAKPAIPIIAPPNSIPRRKPPHAYFDPLDLRTEYLSVFSEVQSLRPEVQSQREVYIRLKSKLFLHNRSDLHSEIEFAELAPALNAAVGRGAFATAINGLAAQIRDGHSEIVEIKEQTAPPVISRLELQVINARAELRALREAIDAMRDAERTARAEIDRIRTDFAPERMQSQRDVIRSLVSEIRAMAQTNAEMNRELEVEPPSLPSEPQAENGKSHRYDDKCSELIDIRGERVSRPQSERRRTDAQPPQQEPAEEKDAADEESQSSTEDVRIGFDEK
jgi:hypothetical protein